jgi:hypothetical protein
MNVASYIERQINRGSNSEFLKNRGPKLRAIKQGTKIANFIK